MTSIPSPSSRARSAAPEIVTDASEVGSAGGAGRSAATKSSSSAALEPRPSSRQAWTISVSPDDAHAVASSSEVNEVEAADARSAPRRKIARSQSLAAPPARLALSRPSAGAVQRRATTPRARSSPVATAQLRTTASEALTAPAPGAAAQSRQAPLARIALTASVGVRDTERD